MLLRAHKPWRILWLTTVACCFSQPVWADADYDLSSDAWNGLRRFVTVAREEGVEVIEPPELDYSQLSPDTGLAIIYPMSDIHSGPLLRFLRQGGRVLIADDFGASSELLERMGVRRSESWVPTGLHFRDQDHLPVAAPVDENHVLALGVRRLVANHPSTIISDLPPVFVVGTPPQPVVTLGAVEEGRVVLVSDPSMLINNMLQFRGNEQFARNVVQFLSGASGRLWIVTRRFAQNDDGQSVSGAASAARRNVNRHLIDGSEALAGCASQEPPWWLALCAVMFLILGVLAPLIKMGIRPTLYRGDWLKPLSKQRSAGLEGTVEYLESRHASYIYPMMILKRELESRLLESLGLPAPTRLKMVLKAYARVEPSPRRRQALDRLLRRLGQLASTATSDRAHRVSPKELQQSMKLAQEILKPLGKEIHKP